MHIARLSLANHSTCAKQLHVAKKNSSENPALAESSCNSWLSAVLVRAVQLTCQTNIIVKADNPACVGQAVSGDRVAKGAVHLKRRSVYGQIGGSGVSSDAGGCNCGLVSENEPVPLFRKAPVATRWTL